MPKFIIGQKNMMTRQWLPDGRQVPVTVVEAGPCVVCAVKTTERDGYRAVQLGYGQAKRLSTLRRGQLGELGSFAVLHEFRVPATDGYQLGQRLDVSQFSVGDQVKVTGLSKGRGFVGVVKRHHFSGQPATHGHKDQLRTSGAIGAGGVQHVFKGTRMAGRLGYSRSTVKNLKVVAVKPELNQLWLRGAVPGARRGQLYIWGETTS